MIWLKREKQFIETQEYLVFWVELLWLNPTNNGILDEPLVAQWNWLFSKLQSISGNFPKVLDFWFDFVITMNANGMLLELLLHKCYPNQLSAVIPWTNEHFHEVWKQGWQKQMLIQGLQKSPIAKKPLEVDVKCFCEVHIVVRDIQDQHKCNWQFKFWKKSVAWLYNGKKLNIIINISLPAI
jgi:hypothetical protein